MPLLQQISSRLYKKPFVWVGADFGMDWAEGPIGNSQVIGSPGGLYQSVTNSLVQDTRTLLLGFDRSNSQDGL